MVKTVLLPVTSNARQLVSYVAGHACTENGIPVLFAILIKIN